MNRTSELALKKINLNYKRNIAQDNTDDLDKLAESFNYKDHKDEYWNPESFSLLWGTPLWDQATPSERIKLNHLYWVAYYAQIISAEIATIFLNQTSAASLYSVEEFATTCRMLDLESLQERAHINSFRKVGLNTEHELFGEAIFMKSMKLPYTETMIYQDTNRAKALIKSWLLKSFALLSSSNVFLGCQYFTVRGLRTLNGKLVQHKLSNYYKEHNDKENAPIPAKISYHHFLDESFHFNSSTIISQELVKLIPNPTNFEKMIINQGVQGCQKDHYYFNSVVNGIFWFEPAMFNDIYKILRSSVFSMDNKEALQMMEKCFTQPNEGTQLSYQIHQEAALSYEAYVSNLDFLTPKTRSMSFMKASSIEDHLNRNKKAIHNFVRGKANG